MLRALKIHLPFGGDPTSRRRRHRFTPTVGESASRLEDRALLSGAGGAATAAVSHHAAVQARHQARHEARLIRREARLARREARLEARHPSSAHAAAMARTMASLNAAIAADPTVTVSPSGAVSVIGPNGVSLGRFGGTRLFGNIASGVTPGSIAGPAALGPNSSLPVGLINPVVGTISSRFPGAVMSSTGISSIATNLVQMPIGTTFAAPAGGGLSLTTATPALSTLGTTGLLSQTNLVSPLSTGLTGLTGTTGIGTGLVSPLGSLLVNGTVPTPGLGSVSAVTTGLLPTSVLTFTPTSITTGASFPGTFNPSPLPLNGTLPFTGTPFNPSPVPLNGVLPFTGTPINPSPIPFTGTLA